LEFNVPFQHRYGYIRDEITVCVLVYVYECIWYCLPHDAISQIPVITMLVCRLSWRSKHLSTAKIFFIIFVTIYMIAVNWLLSYSVPRIDSELRFMQPASKTFHLVIKRLNNRSFFCSMKAPSVSLTFGELMETTTDDWLDYYRNQQHQLQLTRMSPMQIVCAYRCWLDEKCVAFLYRDAYDLTMCRLLHYDQTRCVRRCEYNNSKVSSVACH